MKSENTNAVGPWDLCNKVKDWTTSVDVLATNLIELSQLLNNIEGGTRTWTNDLRNVLYAHLDISQDAILRCSRTMAEFRIRLKQLRSMQSQ